MEALSESPLGWFVYTGHCEDELEFREFVPAPDLDGKLAVMTDELMAEIEEACRPVPPRRLRRVLTAIDRYLHGI